MNSHERKSQNLINNPARIITIGFACAIIIGTILLSMPFASKSGSFTPIIDSLFTATSATCVTGLVVFDTYSHFNIIGQLIIMFLIQIGGLGIVTLTTFFNIAIGKKLGLRNMQLAKESINSDNMFESFKLIKMIIALTLIFEAIGAIILSISFVPKFGASGFFIAIFTSISAYCNAGFDLFGFISPYSSLSSFYNDPLVLYTVMGLIICGGLGFIVWHDLHNYKKNKKLTLHTKIVLIVTSILIVLGCAAFLLFEWNNPNTLQPMNFQDKINNALFQSITTRTAGFNTIDISNMTDISKVFSMILMLIGAAPGSTGGGIKITTVAVILMTVVSLIQGHQDTIILGRKVAKHTVYKSLVVCIIAFFVIFVSTFTIYFTNNSLISNLSGIDAMFESISAFATVGLSTGISAIANVGSSIFLIFTMFLGRVGPVSLALSLTLQNTNNKNKNKHKVIPEGKIIVG